MAEDRIGIEFDDESRRRIKTTLTQWATVHPRRDLPLLEGADGSQLTPRTIAAGARAPESPVGSLVYTMFRLAVDDEVTGPHELGEVLAVFDRDSKRWSQRDEGAPPPEMMR